MRLPQLQRPLGAVASGFSIRIGASSNFAPIWTQWRAGVAAQLGNSNVLVEGRRGAKVKAQGHYVYKPKRTHPKKLGAKRTGGMFACVLAPLNPIRLAWEGHSSVGLVARDLVKHAAGVRWLTCQTLPDQYVIPGNIIFKQYGTLWWPGENTIMGRDFTIHAAATGYVKYYRDPARHPDRKYIGVVFDKDDTLPYPQHAERRRRLGKTGVVMKTSEPKPEMSASGIPKQVVRLDPSRAHLPPQVLGLTKNYSYKEANWRIGRLVESTKLSLKKYPSRKAYLRHRRWARERSLEGARKRDERLRAKETKGKGKKKAAQ